MSPPSSFSSSAPEWEPLAPEELQRLLPQYEITEMIGLGGMGAVYKGRQANLDRIVAIKVLSDTIVQSDDEFNFAARFKQEARAMAKLDHPCIVSVIDFGETSDGHLYLVMEFIDGMDIHQFLEHHGGHLSQEHALSITAHVLDALGYAHSQGIVHRDIKPANILLKQDGRVKIADFGLAKTFGEDPGLTNYALTTTNATVGTPDYVAPEALVMGNAVDQRADLYAVGVMLYRMLTGKLPRESFKMPSEMFPELDPRLDDIVEKATESDPEYRYATAEEIRADIDAVVSQHISRIEVEAEIEESNSAEEAPKSEEKGTGKRTLYIGISIAALLMIGGLSALFMPKNSDGKSSGIKGETQAVPQVSGDVKLPVTTGIDYVTKDKPFVNSLGMRFVSVPITGGPTEGKRVLFSIWETRVKDFKSYVEHKNTLTWEKPTYSQELDHPAVMMSWEDAVDFCEWLTEEERGNGKIRGDEAYRLPTDYEWSCAVGIGDREDPDATPFSKNGGLSGVYPWGNYFPPKEGDGNYYGEETINNPSRTQRAVQIKGYNDGFDRTSPVGSFKANAFGLYDMGGNVWEWVQDWMDPKVKDTRLFRGASWIWPTEVNLRSAARLTYPADSKWGSTGFRVVLESNSDLVLTEKKAGTMFFIGLGEQLKLDPPTPGDSSKIVKIQGNYETWAALKEDGRLISSKLEGTAIPNDHKQVNWFRVGAGMVSAFHPDGTMSIFGEPISPKDRPPENMLHVVQFSLDRGSGIALLRSGEVRLWGSMYSDKEKRSELQDKLKNAQFVGACENTGWTVDAGGQVLRWEYGGAPKTIGQHDNIAQFAVGQGHYLILTKEGRVEGGNSDLVTNPVINVPAGQRMGKNIRIGYWGSALQYNDNYWISWGGPRESAPIHEKVRQAGPLLDLEISVAPDKYMVMGLKR